jgi:hypothetical protein
MTLSAALLEHWVFGAFLCKFVNFAPTLTALVSTFTVAVIAVERWFFIVNKQKFHRRCTITILVLLWLASILIALPEFISRQMQEFIPPTILPYMMKMYPASLSKIYNNTDISASYNMFKSPCKMKKIFYCVLKPDLRMRIFSYLVITLQYLVPLLFVSVSCYSISRFLKRRMERMRVYQIHHHRASAKSHKYNRKKSSLNKDELTEPESTSNDDLPITIITNGNKSYQLLTRFRNTFQNREPLNDQNTLHLNHQQHYLKCQSHSERRFHRSRKLLICIAALFTISWLPLTIVQIYLEHHGEMLYTREGANYVYGYLLIPCYLISSLPAWINPVIYNYINRSFRREFYALYSCCFKVSTSTSRKELTSVEPRRQRRETTNIDEINIPPSAHPPGIKQAVSFVDETTVMMHK